MLEELTKLLKHSSAYSLGNILNKAVGFLLIPFYTHYLTTADYGTLELLDLSITLVGLLLNLWMNASLVRHYYEYDDATNRNQVVGTAMIATSCAAALVSAGGFVCAREISSLILKSSGFELFVRIIALNLFFTCLNSVSFSYLRALQKPSVIVTMNTVSLAMSLGLNIYFLAVLKTGVVGVLCSSLISNALVTTALTISTVRQAGIHFDWAKLKQLAKFGLPLIVTSFSAFELNFADRFFLQHYSTVSTVGIYALGYKFGYMLSFLLIQPFMMIWGARMYQIAKRPDAGVIFSRIVAYFTLVMSVVALGMSLVIKDIIAIVASQQFHEAYRVVAPVALAYVFYGISYYFQTGIYISKRTTYLGLMGFICAAANIALNFLLIPRFAALGAAWATVLSFFLMAIVAYVLSQRVYQIPYALSRVALPVIAAIGVYFVSTLINVSSLFGSLGLKLLLLLGFGVMVFALGFFDEPELCRLRQTLQVVWGRFGWRMASSPGR